MPRIEVEIQPAPSTPLNLRLGVLYAPRVPTPPVDAYDVVEVAPDAYHVRSHGSIDGDRFLAIVRCSSTAAAWMTLARYLRMDVPANQEVT